MADPRITAANARVADIALKGRIQDDVKFVKPIPKTVIAPVLDLHDAPKGPVARQLLFGQSFNVLEEADGWSFGQSIHNGYVGYVDSSSLGRFETPTLRVATLGTHIYPKPDIKTQPIASLPFASEIAVQAEAGDFIETRAGFIFARQLEPVTALHVDYVALAERMIGLPYLWGGNSHWGIDCSGLVELVLRLAQIDCPPDSDLQEAALGAPLDVTMKLKRGDFVFWKGHVGIMQSATQLIHANGFHMAVTSENLFAVLKRIETAGGGRMTASKRL